MREPKSPIKYKCTKIVYIYTIKTPEWEKTNICISFSLAESGGCHIQPSESNGTKKEIPDDLLNAEQKKSNEVHNRQWKQTLKYCQQNWGYKVGWKGTAGQCLRILFF